MSFLPQPKGVRYLDISEDGPEINLGIGAGPIGGIEIKFGVDPKTGAIGPKEQNTRVGPFNTRIYEDGCDVVEERYYEMFGEKIVIDVSRYHNEKKCGPKPPDPEPKPVPTPPGSTAPTGIYPPGGEYNTSCPYHIVWSADRENRFCHTIVYGPIKFYPRAGRRVLMTRVLLYGGYDYYYVQTPPSWWFHHNGVAVTHNWLAGGVNVYDTMDILIGYHGPSDVGVGWFNMEPREKEFHIDDLERALENVIDKGWSRFEPVTRTPFWSNGLYSPRMPWANNLTAEQYGITKYTPLISITQLSSPSCGQTPVLPQSKLKDKSSSCCCCKEETKK